MSLCPAPASPNAVQLDLHFGDVLLKLFNLDEANQMVSFSVAGFARIKRRNGDGVAGVGAW